jgi:competence protein ComEC
MRWRVVGVTDPPQILSDPADLDRDQVRNALSGEIALPGSRTTALYQALLLGDTTGIEGPIRDAFADTGTAHILAISGLNLTLIGLGLRWVLLRALVLVLPRARQVLRLPALAAGLALGLTWIFVGIVSRSDATWRAAVMLTVLLLGEVIARHPLGLRSLGLAAGAVILADPFSVAGASFQLSFAAAAALLLVQPLCSRWTAWCRAPERGLGRGAAALAGALGSLVAVTVAAFGATAPLSQAWFGQVAPVGLWVNLGAVPLSSLVVLPVGFVWWVLSLVAPEAAAAVAFLPDLAGRWLLEVVEGWSDLAGPSTGGGWPIAAGVLGCLAVLVLCRATPHSVAVALCLAGVAAAVVYGAEPTGLRATALDVAHGDAMLVELPGAGALLVDTGGTWRSAELNQALARHTVLPALVRRGVDAIEVLAVSHAHPDHVGAAAEVVARVPVRELWLPPCALDAPAFDGLARAVLAKGGVVRMLVRGDRATWGEARIDVLWPPADAVRADGSCRLGLNDGSLVLRLTYAGRSLLLSGDIEEAAERELLAFATPLASTVLKVPHHGSRTSSTPSLVEAVSPGLAIVSGGYRTRSRFPPHLEVLARYQREGIPTFITGRDGAVTIRIDPAGTLEVGLPSSGRVSPPR